MKLGSIIIRYKQINILDNLIIVILIRLREQWLHLQKKNIGFDRTESRTLLSNHYPQTVRPSQENTTRVIWTNVYYYNIVKGPCLFIEDTFRNLLGRYCMYAFEPKYNVFRIFVRLSVCWLQHNKVTTVWIQTELSLLKFL